MRNAIFVLFTVAACSSPTARTGNHDGGGVGNGKHDLSGGGGGDTPDMFVKIVIDDPFPPYCGPGTMDPPPQPGGTEDCPDDKNLQGCPCDQIGKQAPCFPGLRANRNLGQCKDGVATCVQISELNAVWGECDGAILPDPTATSGAAACKCFSSGYWDVTNLGVCVGQTSATAYEAFGGSIVGMGTGAMLNCDTKPTTWSTDTLKVDCAGNYTLCYTIKAGDSNNPKDSDCVVGKVCATADYTTAGMTQTWPPLQEWMSSSSTCAQQFITTGGYGQMSVKGKSITCDDIPDHVFQTNGYCTADQTNCSAGGGGPFGN